MQRYTFYVIKHNFPNKKIPYLTLFNCVPGIFSLLAPFFPNNYKNLGNHHSSSLNYIIYFNPTWAILKYYNFFPSLFQQVWAETACTLHCLLMTPLTNTGLMSRQQDFRNLPSIIISRTCIHRRSKQIILK